MRYTHLPSNKEYLNPQCVVSCRHGYLVMSQQLTNLIMVVGFEWIIIIAVIVILFFGVKKIPQLAEIIWKSFSGIPEIQTGSRSRISAFERSNRRL